MTKVEFKKDYPIGTKVIYTVDVNVYPHDIIKKGETGTISFDDDKNVYIKLDVYHPELLDWENQHIYNYLDELDVIIEQIERLDKSLYELNKLVCQFESVTEKYRETGADDTHSREVLWDIIINLKKNKTAHVTIPNNPDGWHLYEHTNHQQKLINKSAVVALHEISTKIIKLIKCSDAKTLKQFYAQYK